VVGVVSQPVGRRASSPRGCPSPTIRVGATLHWRQEFPGAELQLRQVRRTLESRLPECPSRDAVISIATEFAANAVQHSRSGHKSGYFVVELAWGGSTARIMVTDCGGPHEPRLRMRPYGEYGERGCGLHMVRELSARWGVFETGANRGRLA
jgi:serine/threonine-protein kinase RsbW